MTSHGGDQTRELADSSVESWRSPPCFILSENGYVWYRHSRNIAEVQHLKYQGRREDAQRTSNMVHAASHDANWQSGIQALRTKVLSNLGKLGKLPSQLSSNRVVQNFLQTSYSVKLLK